MKKTLFIFLLVTFSACNNDIILCKPPHCKDSTCKDSTCKDSFIVDSIKELQK